MTMAVKNFVEAAACPREGEMRIGLVLNEINGVVLAVLDRRKRRSSQWIGKAQLLALQRLEEQSIAASSLDGRTIKESLDCYVAWLNRRTEEYIARGDLVTETMHDVAMEMLPFAKRLQSILHIARGYPTEARKRARIQSDRLEAARRSLLGR